MTRLVAIALATLASEDLTAIGAGLLIRAGDLPLAGAVVACAAGIYAGDLGLWLAGRLLGTHVLRWRRVSAIVPAARVSGFAAWFDAHARAAILTSRFTPGARLPLYLAAGACRSRFRTFAGWSFAAVAVWTPILVGLAVIAGGEVATAAGAWLSAGRLTLPLAALLLLGGWQGAMRSWTLRRQQRVIACVSRLWRWEFWPMWLFYLPVGLWTAWLALRHGGYRTLTAANPGIADGGVVGESKFAIQSRLPPAWTIPAALIAAGPAHARCRALAVEVADRQWQYPLVLKPDVGQRGVGVKLTHTPCEAEAYLAREAGAVIVQPYHPGPFEAGVFYYRAPGMARGRILAITDKHFPAVIGDDHSTLEDLVWAHPRYRMQADRFLARLADRALDIPAAGDRISLGIAGNHAQGAMFTDGAHLLTTELEARIDEIARAYDGFCIGRFDIRYRDREAFMAGRDLAIVELNGATAECTNVYDPDRSLLSAYATLFTQWRLVFEIGAANRRTGTGVCSRSRLIWILRTHLSAKCAFPVSD